MISDIDRTCETCQRWKGAIENVGDCVSLVIAPGSVTVRPFADGQWGDKWLRTWGGFGCRMWRDARHQVGEGE